VLTYQEIIRAAFLDLPSHFPDAQCIAVVTHGGACRAILAMLADGRLAKACDAQITVDQTANCSITHLSVCPNGGGYNLQCVNDVEHLLTIGATSLDHG
jgi:broad specificity phosphatase PhoE